MLSTMRTVAAAGMALVTAGAANAGGPDFKLSINLGGCGPVICPPPVCEPVVRYRKETVWETVPRTEVWYDDCGRRHTRVVYEKVCRTVWVPIEDCHPYPHATVVVGDDCDDDGWRGRGRHGWDRDGPGRHRGHDRGWDRDDNRGWERGERRHADASRDERGGHDRDFGGRIAPTRLATVEPAHAEQRQGPSDAARRAEAEQKVRAAQAANRGKALGGARAEKGTFLDAALTAARK